MKTYMNTKGAGLPMVGTKGPEIFWICILHLQKRNHKWVKGKVHLA